MKGKYRIHFILTLLILILPCFTYLNENNSSIVHINKSNFLVSVCSSILKSYTVHDPIHITNDNELAALANTGTGTSINPYIISDWNITGSAMYGIYITGTTKHFRIENCLIVNSNIWGIYVDDITSGTATISNNICVNSSKVGIYVKDSSFSTITNNTCISNGENGIYIWLSGSSTISNNTCSSNEENGIYIWLCAFSIVTNNICTGNNGIGLYLGGSDSSFMTFNVCNSNDEDGIYLSYSDFAAIANNTCNNNSGDGISLNFAINSITANNTCTLNNWRGIYIWDSDSTIITDNICTRNNRTGISLASSHYSKETNNICNNNSEDGIFLDRSSFSTIIWNILVENGNYGIELFRGSENNTIHHNSFVTNGWDISQACDNGMNNQWYDKTILEGNSWSDYSGTGSYFIVGSAGTSDPYPFVRISSDSDDFIPLLIRSGLFLFILGLLLIEFLINKYKKSRIL